MQNEEVEKDQICILREESLHTDAFAKFSFFVSGGFWYLTIFVSFQQRKKFDIWTEIEWIRGKLQNHVKNNFKCFRMTQKIPLLVV